MKALLGDMNLKIGDFSNQASQREKKVETSYRKSTYYEQDIQDIKSYISNITIIYVILVLTYAISSLFIFGYLKDRKTWAVVVGLVAYPFVITRIHLFINNIFKTIFINVSDLDKKIISA